MYATYMYVNGCNHAVHCPYAYIHTHMHAHTHMYSVMVVDVVSTTVTS